MIIDTFGAVPDRPTLRSWLSGFCRFRGYVRMFGRQFAGASGQDLSALLERFEREPRGKILDEWLDALAVMLPPVDAYVQMLDVLDVQAVGVWVHVEPDAAPNPLDNLAEHCRRFPGRFLPLPSYEPTIADRPAVVARDHERIGLSGVCLLPILDDRPADDRANRPLFETCVDLDLPVWIHTVNTWSERHPSEFCHPRHVDRIACDFPDLRIVMGHGGWPWVAEAVAVAWRHPNVYIEPSAFRYKYLAAPGGGWEPLLCHGNTTIADKVLFGSLWPLVGVTLDQAIEEVRALPLKPETLERWTYTNAKRFYKL